MDTVPGEGFMGEETLVTHFVVAATRTIDGKSRHLYTARVFNVHVGNGALGISQMCLGTGKLE